MRVAVEGCSHGELDAIYASILKAEKEGNFKTDLLLLCGDFQALRNLADLECLAVPHKYQRLGAFHKYYSGEKVAPLLTIVIGGNHEASNYMWELYHGGWLAPNIYFLGQAGVVDVGGLIIAGASGIYKSHDYTRGRYERLPYDKSSIRSIYHTRIYDIWRLKLLASSSASQPDIFLSHDWPNTIEQYGNTASLIKRKPFFKDEIQTSTLGSPPLLELLHCLRPSYWFSAHLHVKFAAIFRHGQSRRGAQANSNLPSDNSHQHGGYLTTTEPPSNNPEAIDVDFSDDDAQEVHSVSRGNCIADNPSIDDVELDEDPPHTHDHDAQPPAENGGEAPSALPSNETRFLALSKCLPGHDFLQFLDVDPKCNQNPPGTASVSQSASKERQFPPLRFVPRWLAILRATNHLLSLTRQQAPLPFADDTELLAKIEHEEHWVRNELQDAQNKDGLAIGRIQQFMHTAPTSSSPGGRQRGPPPWYTNPQTEAFTRWLGIENKINPPPIVPQLLPQGVPIPLKPREGDSALLMGPLRVAPMVAPPPLTPADEEAEIRSIEAAAIQASRARKRFKNDEDKPSEPLMLEEDESIDGRWKEGTG